MLINYGQDKYVNRFTLRMQEPTTQEEIDRKDSKSSSVGVAQDILGLTDMLQRESSKLRILKTLISPIVADSEITKVIEEEIELAQQQEQEGGMGEEDMDDFGDEAFGGGHSGMHIGGGMNDFVDLDDFGDEGSIGDESGTEGDFGEEGGTDSLPNPSELGDMDFTDNNMEF